ncbi:uricase [Erpetoichthys calabaricus]|uniref:Uricase n=1 Tax=Erpetoichthys calabaricus TaxID=27687 RepID=A0A8C4X9S5_ERPCA|nr:uricase [Erpetoichthys calabaricus]
MAHQNKAVEFVRTGYGKNIVKLLHIKRQGKFQDIKELEVSVQLTLRTKKDYLDGDNADIIPTDTIKNTVHVLAKLKGVQTTEEFALDICSYFLNTFKHVERVRVNIDEAPWKRLEKNGVEHVHAFIYSPEGIHFCEAEQYQNEAPVLHSGLKEMKVLKTTQSGFEGFIKDKYTTLPEVRDRCFCTVVYTKWRYNKFRNIAFDSICHTVKNSIIEQFAGPYNEGEYSPSVQKTLYDTQVLVLNKVPEIEEIEIVMPNKHYFTIDMSKMGLTNKDEVLLPLDNPSGNITGTVRRKPFSKL